MQSFERNPIQESSWDREMGTREDFATSTLWKKPEITTIVNDPNHPTTFPITNHTTRQIIKCICKRITRKAAKHSINIFLRSKSLYLESVAPALERRCNNKGY